MQIEDITSNVVDVVYTQYTETEESTVPAVPNLDYCQPVASSKPLRTKDPQPRKTRAAMRLEDPEDFSLSENEISWYRMKYITKSKEFGEVTPKNDKFLQCGCLELQCFTGSPKWSCGYCEARMSSYCVLSSSNLGCCRTCYTKEHVNDKRDETPQKSKYRRSNISAN
jgi:hypothetical protein